MPIDDRLVFFEGKYVRLKTLDESDILESEWVGWFNSEKLCEFNQHHYFPNTFEKQRSFVATLQGTDKLQLGIIDRLTPDKICGVVSLDYINLVHRNAEIAGIHSMSHTKSNPAIFLESWSCMIRHGFEHLGLRKIHGGTFHPHVPGALKRAFNFQVEGIRRQHVFKHNTYHDVTLLAVFADTVQYPDF